MTHENSISLIYLPLNGSFLNIPPFPFFQIRSIAHNKNPGNAGNYQIFENLDFLFQTLKDSTYIYQNNDVKTLNPNKTQINWYFSPNLTNLQKYQISFYGCWNVAKIHFYIQHFLPKKTIYIFIQSKKDFSFVRILSFKKNIFIFNQNILVFKKFLFSNEFFFVWKIYFYSIGKNVLNEIFLFNHFG